MESDLLAHDLIDLFERDRLVLEFCCRELQPTTLHHQALSLLVECQACIHDLEVEAHLDVHAESLQASLDQETVDKAGSFLFRVGASLRDSSRRLEDAVGRVFGLMCSYPLDSID